MSFTVVLLDGKERHNLSFEEVQDLFFKRQINQTSLICSIGAPQWQMLKKVFDLAQWIPAHAPQAPPSASHQTNYQPQINPFDQPAPVLPPVTFNQFPPNPPAAANNNFAQNPTSGYSQNNQSETYYQAETDQSQYNFQNNQTNFAPSNYNQSADNFNQNTNNYGQPANNYNPPPNNYNQPNNNYNQPNNNYNYQPNNRNYAANNRNAAQNAGLIGDDRYGLKPAAIFLIVNALFNIVWMVMENLIATSGAAPTNRFGNGGVRIIISVVIDVSLAYKLWQRIDIQTTRNWVLIRTYLGFIVFGLIVPIVSAGTDGVIAGAINFIVAFVLLVSVLLVLHGKQSPPPARVIFGIATFAVFFLINIGILGLSSIALLVPNIGKLQTDNRQLNKYKIEGKEFEDKTTGAKVVLPEGWSMLELSNPLIHTPEARMIAVDKPGNRLTMLEVVPVPATLDMKRVDTYDILEQLSNNVVKSLKEETENTPGFGKNTFNEVTRMNIFIGKHPAKLLIFDKTQNGEKVKGHLIITFDELTFYVLHSWCPADEYEQAQNDFTFFEKNFTVPEKINSPYTQSADNEKNKSLPKK
jgi:hypothetical protein